MTTLKTSFNQPAEHQQDKKFLTVLSGLNILLLVTTLLAYSLTQKTLAREKQKIFEQTSERVQQWIEERMLTHVTTLKGLQAFWAGSNSGVTKEEFSAYTASLNLLNDYPGISSVAFF